MTVVSHEANRASAGAVDITDVFALHFSLARFCCKSMAAIDRWSPDFLKQYKFVRRLTPVFAKKIEMTVVTSGHESFANANISLKIIYISFFER